MAEILSVAGGALLTVVFEEILKKLESKFIRSLNLSKEILEKLKCWRSKLPKIQALLVDAEEKQMFNPNSGHVSKEWLAEIKDLAYDMEDVLDEFDIDLRRKELISPASRQASSSKCMPSCFSCFNAKRSDLIFDSEIVSKVDDIVNRLLWIEDELKLLGLVSSGNQGGKWSASRGLPPTTSLPEPHVYGREKEKEAILQKLLDSDSTSKGFSVVPILGMGGVGKTTLARLVYNEVKPECFEPKAWICVSDQFDIPSITRIILEAVGGKCDSKDLNLLQQARNSKLSNKKFLLVLDDVWNDNYDSWVELSKPFLSGAAGSKIIVTTRNDRVAQIMAGKDKAYTLQVLGNEDCLSIFAQHALEEENFGRHQNLKVIGDELVKKCRGLPLVAKTLGGLLRGELDPSEWSRISNSKIWELPDDRSNILPALRLSYIHLPFHLKPCFVYCAMFPKDYVFDMNELVLLWMGGGILKEPSEEVGRRYFSELVSRAFFQRSNENESLYMMHDLIHDLAQFVAGEMCFDEERMLEVANKSKVNFEKVRHFSFCPKFYDVSKRFEFLREMRSLRTFIPAKTFRWRRFSHLSNEVVHDWLPKLKCLRALSLEDYLIMKLPDSMGDLRRLTYLNLCGTRIEILPESVGSLIQLQSLLLRNCCRFRKFPRTIGNLIELHHVDVRHTNSLKEMPLGVCNLKNLVTLSKFIVGKTNESLRLYHLENFSRLRGELSILDLHNVLDVVDATKANVGKIDGLDKLILEWTSDFSDSRDECNVELQVLSKLRPHPNLTRLEVVSYGGKEFSSWIGDPAFSNLSHLELRSCKNCTSLPSLGLLPALKELIIRGMDAVKVVDEEFFGLNGTFPSLVVLVFNDMLKWEEWSCSVGGSGLFPCLHELQITNCPALTEKLPSHLPLPSCRKLVIENCNDMSMVDITSFSGLEALTVKRCPSLQCFVRGKIPTALKCENLESPSDSVVMPGDNHDNSNDSLPSLKKFEVVDCKKLKCLPEEILQQCTSLESIKINGSYEILKSFLSLGSCLTSLERLEIYDIEGCESLPEMSLSIPNLKYLHMENCPSIESIPDGGLPPNLLELHISKWENLKSLPKLGLSTPNLKHLKIKDCQAIECIPDGVLALKLSVLQFQEWKNLKSLPNTMGLLESLQTLWIVDCENLKSIPKSMHYLRSLESLRIRRCPGIEYIADGLLLPSLVDLQLSDCKNLKSIPKSMHSLRSLETLEIWHCPGIEYIADERLPPNLVSLQLSDCENLIKSLPNTMYELTSLQGLSIGNGNLMAGWNLHSLTSLQRITISKACPPDLVLPSSVTDLKIFNLENQECILKLLFQNLISLQSLTISDCPKLHSLPKEAMPPSIGSIWIYRCPLLKRQRFEAKGDYWPLTRNSPCVVIDMIQVDTSPPSKS